MTLPPPGPPSGPPSGPPPGPPSGPPPNWGQPEPPTQQIPAQQIPAQPVPAPEPAEPESSRRWSRDPLSIALVLVIVAALGLAGLLGGELYARNKADTIIAKAVSCVVQDSASASFGMRPFLIQHFSHHYHDMVVETAGNRIREAQGMKLKLRLDDIRLNQTADSAGTLGALDADTLEIAMSALENLQAGGKTIGVISHVPAMQERIAAQINVTKESGGCSRVRMIA